MPQVHMAAPYGSNVPSAGLLNHFLRLIDARDTPCRRQLREEVNNHSGSETNFQHAVVSCDLKKCAHRGAVFSIRSRHDVAAELTQAALRATKHAHKKGSHHAHR